VHIAEGILPAHWAAAWAVPAAAAAAVGLRQVTRRVEEQPSFKPLLGLMGAAVFIISLMPIPVPVAGSVSHPAGTPLAAVVVGPPGTVVLATISLLLQALFFAHGGLTTLGANVISEGLVGALVAFTAFRMARRMGAGLFAAGFAAGFLGDLGVYATTASQLGLGLFALPDAPARSAAVFLAFLPTQLPLALLEGVFTGGVLRALAEARPDVAGELGLTRAGGRNAGTRPRGRHRSALLGRRSRLVVGVVGTALLVASLWVLVWSVATSTSSWVGLDESVIESVAGEAGREAVDPLFDVDSGDLLALLFAGGALAGGLLIGWLARGLLRPARSLPGWVLLGLAALPGLLLVAALASGTIGSGSLSEAAVSLLRPTRGEVISAQGGDLVLFLFLLTGLTPGMAFGWWSRGRLAGAQNGRRSWSERLRRPTLPHLHVHDFRSGDRLAWQGRGLARVDARLKLAGTVLLLVLNLVGGWVVSLALLVAALALLVWVQRIRRAVLAVRLVPALVVFGMLLLLRGFSVPGRALLLLDLPLLAPVQLTTAGLAAGAQLGLVVLAGVAMVVLLGVSTPLPALLPALRWYRVPSLLVEIGLLMYRYLFLMAEEGGRIRQAQRLRGPQVPWARAMGGLSRLGAILLVRSYDRAQRVHDAQRLRSGEVSLPGAPAVHRRGRLSKVEEGGSVG
jgi:cobalt/nickel transport system permease protein